MIFLDEVHLSLLFNTFTNFWLPGYFILFNYSENEAIFKSNHWNLGKNCLLYL